MAAEFRTHDGLTLRYRSWSRDPDPSLPPVVLLHGFAVDARLNWEGPGVVEALLGFKGSLQHRLVFRW
ncbi:hypothetical protein ACFPN0_08170 [Kitasatospora cinereorecta]